MIQQISKGNAVSITILGIDHLPAKEKADLATLLAAAIKDPGMSVVSNFDYSIQISVRTK